MKDAVFSATKGGREICGLLIDNGYFIELLPTKNKNRKGGGFEFYPEEIRDINVISQKVGHEIVGTYHSHPLYIASPCRTDIANAVDDSIMLIIDATDKKRLYGTSRMERNGKLHLH